MLITPLKKIGVNALLVLTFCIFFHFGPYISILPPLVPKLINVCYFSHFLQSKDRNN